MRGSLTIAVVWIVALCALPASAQISGLNGFSESFLRDYKAAQKKVDQLRSAEPLIALLGQYTGEMEQAELELSIGLAYNQRTGVIDFAKAAHFTATLQYNFPEKTYIQILEWRGYSQQQLKRNHDAVADYLRGLLACADFDLEGGWPERKKPKVMASMNSGDPDDIQRMRDYSMYRKNLDLRQFLMMKRYGFIDQIKTLQTEASINDRQIIEILETLTPDSSRFGTITRWLEGENRRPWP